MRATKEDVRRAFDIVRQQTAGDIRSLDVKRQAVATALGDFMFGLDDRRRSLFIEAALGTRSVSGRREGEVLGFRMYYGLERKACREGGRS